MVHFIMLIFLIFIYLFLLAFRFEPFLGLGFQMDGETSGNLEAKANADTGWEMNIENE